MSLSVNSDRWAMTRAISLILKTFQNSVLCTFVCLTITHLTRLHRHKRYKHFSSLLCASLRKRPCRIGRDLCSSFLNLSFWSNGSVRCSDACMDHRLSIRLEDSDTTAFAPELSSRAAAQEEDSPCKDQLQVQKPRPTLQ